MAEWLAGLAVVDKVFLGTAIVGGTLFAARMVMTLLGVGGDDGGDGGDSGDLDHDTNTSEQTDLSFKLMSFQAFMAFLMMFGLAGLAMSQGSKFAALISLTVAMAAGLSSVWVLRWLFSFFSKMQSSGTLDIKQAIGRRGRVYLTVPARGPGKVEIVTQGRMMVMNAVSAEGTAIPTDEEVEVVEVRPGDLLVVRRF